MASGNGGLSWSEQWGSRDEEGAKLAGTKQGKPTSGKKMQEMKAAASVGMAKAKVAASVGAEKAKVVASVGAEKAKVGALKVKSGTVSGFKWIKEHVSKKRSTGSSK